MNWLRYFLISFFLLTLSIPIVSDISGFTSSEGLDENRFIKSYDQISFPQKLALYVKNFDRQFWGREYLVKVYIFLKKDIIGISPLPEKVIIGEEGWLYLADYGAMDDCRNARPFFQAQLDSIQDNLRHIAFELQTRGIRFYVAVVPDKHTIYPEHLPDYVQKIRPRSRLQQLSQQLESEPTFSFINLTDTLCASKKTGNLYFKLESHWNDLGAFIGYMKIMKTIKKDFPEINSLTLDSCQSTNGKESDLDLAKLLGQDISYTEETRKITPLSNDLIQSADAGVMIPPAKRFNANYAFRNINPMLDGADIIVYRDSFFGSLTPFFDQSFASATYIWTNDIDLDFVKKQSPEIVLLEIAERHIDLLAR